MRYKEDGGLCWAFVSDAPSMHVVKGTGDQALCGAYIDSVRPTNAPEPVCLKCAALLKRPKMRARSISTTKRRRQ